MITLTSKQRAYLKSLAMNTEPIFQIGKNSITPEYTASVDEALAKRELIKLSILKSCDDDPKELAEMIAGRTKAVVVQIIGKKIVLYRPAKKPQIELPKASGPVR